MLVWIFFALILSIGSAETIQQLLLTPVQGGDLGFLRALNNYFGCKTWINGQCTQCAPNFIFNDNKICREVTPQCMKFNRGVGICEQCYLGYLIFSGQCVLQNIAETLDRGCKKFENGNCAECSERYFFGGSGNCQQVSNLCRKWNYQTGQCTACYQGYRMEQGACIENSLIAFGAVDSFCFQWSQGNCLKCAERAFFGPIGLCIPVSDYCRTWDNFDGFCLTCYKGYDLKDGGCTQSAINTQGPSDIGCKQWDWQNQVCIQCSARWVFTNEGICAPVSDDCKFYNDQGLCSQCYTGYELINGQCIFSNKNFEGPSDLGCKLWNWDEMKCLECSERWIFIDGGRCIPTSDDCKNYNLNGQCTDCYRGYDLIDRKCIISDSNLLEPTDPGCKIWNWEQQVCFQCSYRWYFDSSKVCRKVSTLCQGYNSTGQCINCYPGYQLNNGECKEAENDRCSIKQNGVCIECYLGYQIKNGKCTLGNPLCRDTDQSGNCTSCFTTYVLYKNICVPLVKLVNLAKYYAENDPGMLEQLKRDGRIV